MWAAWPIESIRSRAVNSLCIHRYVLWPRIDQKTCLKAIVSANLEVIPLPNVLEEAELHTDMAAIQQEIDRLGAESIVGIVTTTSCFAPRAADSIVDVAKLCKASGIGHIVNNAYGVQSSALSSLVNIHLLPAFLEHAYADPAKQQLTKSLSSGPLSSAGLSL